MRLKRIAFLHGCRRPARKQSPDAAFGGLCRAAAVVALAAVLLLPSAAGADTGKPIRLTVVDVMEVVLSSNRDLVDAAEHVEEADLSLEGSLSDFRWKVQPGTRAEYASTEDDEGGTIGAQVAVKKRMPAGGDLSVEPGLRGGSADYRSGIGLSLSQPLLKGRGGEFARSGVYALRHGLDNARRAFLLRRIDVVLSAVAAFYEVARLQEEVRIREELAARLGGHVEAAESKQRYGLTSPLDVYRARIQLKQAEDALIATREALRRSRDDLKIILALPLGRELEVSFTLEYAPVSMEETTAVEIALANRLELEEAREAVREAERLARLAENNVLPDLSLAISYERYGEDERFAESLGFEEHSLSLVMTSSTDFSRTRERQEYRKSLLAVERSRRALEKRKDEIERDVKRDLFSLRRLQDRLGVQREQIEDVRGQLELARVKFRHGLTDNFDLIDAETRLEQTQADTVSIIVDHIVGTYRLRGALGTLLEAPGT